MSKSCIHSVPNNSVCPICEEISPIQCFGCKIQDNCIKCKKCKQFFCIECFGPRGRCSKCNKKIREFIRYLGIW